MSAHLKKKTKKANPESQVVNVRGTARDSDLPRVDTQNQNKPSHLESNLLKSIVSGAAVLGLLWITRTLLVPILMGGILAALFFPAVVRLQHTLKLTRTPAAIIVSIGAVLSVVLPFVFLVFVAVKNSWKWFVQFKASGALATQVSGFSVDSIPGATRVMAWVTQMFPLSTEELNATIADVAKSLGVQLAEFLGDFFSQIPSLSLGIGLSVVSLFFCLMDSDKILGFIRRISVFSREETERILEAFSKMSRSVFLASVFSGGAQAIIFSICGWIAGVGHAGLLLSVVFLASFIPVIGSAPLTLGLCIYEWSTRGTSSGVILLVGVILVSSADNVIRPMVLKGAGNLHPLLGLVAAFGGLEVFGFVGIFLGPILAGMALVGITLILERRERENRA
jgi:predicted PurR-regulated permease PerM